MSETLSLYFTYILFLFSSASFPDLWSSFVFPSTISFNSLPFLYAS